MRDPSARALLTPEADQITLRVGGLDFGGWTSISIDVSLESAHRTFQFDAFPRWPTEPNPARIRPGSYCEVEIGGERVASAFVDAWGSSGDADDRALHVSGRSITADVVDSDARDRTRFKDRSLFQIAEALCAPHGIEVALDPAIAADPLVTRKFRAFKVNTGEKVYAVIERAARSRAVLLTDDEQGRLVLTRAGTLRAATALVMGENVHTWDVSFDASQLFTSYTCKGQRVPVDGDAGDDAIRPEATVADPMLEFTGRTRIMTITPEGGASIERCRQRAQWEAAARFGKAFTLSYTVVGWRQGNGDLWKVNELVQLTDDVNGIEGEYLISELTYSLGDGGAQTVLRLVPPEAFELLPPAERKGTGRKAGGWAELADGVALPGATFTPAPATQSLVP